MDAIVLQAIAKWPHVPACTGWLGLDARGTWYLRDAAAQACGAFASGTPGARGTPLRHEALLAFIGRNYAADARGRWFFQNGPQRVFVELDSAPWIWRVDDAGAVSAHTGSAVRAEAAWLDEHGRLFLSTSLGFGLVHTQDMGRAARRIEEGFWQPRPVRADELCARFGFVLSPQAAAA